MRGLWILAVLVSACGKEATVSDAPGAPLHFTDVTQKTGIDFVTTSGATPSTQILEVKGGGLALIDYDADGDLDVFVANGATLDDPERGPGCRLFRNDGGWRFTDVTEGTVDFQRWGFGVAVADYDGDGFDDLFVACYGRNALLCNEGGRFVEVTEAAGLVDAAWSTAAAFGDVDGDGDLDLYVANYLRFDARNPPPRTTYLGADVFLGPRGLDPEADVLWENQGDGTFRDVTQSSGCDAPPAFGLGVLILDLDGDARAEIFVGNDSGGNFLFRRGADGRFEEAALHAGLAVNEFGVEQATMGIAVGDVNGDGLPDLCTSNFMNDTNTLHVNLGELLFEDQTQRMGLAMLTRPFVGWASMFYDFDHDGDEDLVTFNGHVYPEVVTAPRNWNHAQTPLLFERDGERFRAVLHTRGGDWLAATHCDRSAAFGDLDGDGDIDVVAGALNGPLRVLENDGARGPWLIVELDDAPHPSNRRGLGSRVEVRAPGRTWTRWVHGKGSYQSANAPYAHFGLPADAARVDVHVTWPDGAETVVRDVEPGQRVSVERPQ
ncbi:MAG: CRTAC1 family protein [bacterium]|nr:CRTAC1 family protein [bacterium]